MWAIAGPLIGAAWAAAPPPVLKRSDVVFMYQASRQTYADYGATVLAWGGQPTPTSLAEAKGLRFFGSVGMVTEFAAYHDRFPETYRDGLCLDAFGEPVKVPWLTDHQHKGIPYWWCCTQQPNFRTYLRERVAATMKAGADGLHIDDHMGTSGGLWLGVCFCDRCNDGFRQHLKGLGQTEQDRLGIRQPEAFDYRGVMRAWLRESPGRQAPQHPLWGEWSVYQSKMAVALMEELHAYANEVAGKRVPLGANAGLLWPGHLQDYRTIDLFSAETDHHAAARRLSDTPIFAYRLADAVGRPYASTASGGDWAFIKEHNLPGLVRSWIALSYAAGHSLMAPHRQWCYTPEKGTHWYEGPAERFAPLYRFVRSNALLFDDFAAHADVGVVVPHASYRAEPAKWTALADRLAAANVGYRILLGGDRTVDHRIAARDVSACTLIVAPDRDKLQPADRAVVDARAARPGVVTTVDEALNRVRPAVGVRGAAVRAFARVARRQVVVHLVNTDYDPSADDVREITNVGVSLDLKALGVPGARIARLHAPGSTAVDLAVVDGRIVVPRLGLWAILLVR